MTTESMITVSNPLWHLLKQADLVSITILLILFALSIMCWSLFLGKIIAMRIKKKQLTTMSKQLAYIQTLEDLHDLATKNSNTLPGYLMAKGLLSFKQIQNQQIEQQAAHHYLIDAFRYEVDMAIEGLVTMQESYISFFSTSAAVAPLLGLLGTIWGLIHAFIRIGQYQSADIVAVAPGIAEALIATFAGLLVAIPALVMYNYCLMQVHTLERNLQPIADKVTAIILPLLIR